MEQLVWLGPPHTKPKSAEADGAIEATAFQSCHIVMDQDVEMSGQVSSQSLTPPEAVPTLLQLPICTLGYLGRKEQHGSHH